MDSILKETRFLITNEKKEETYAKDTLISKLVRSIRYQKINVRENNVIVYSIKCTFYTRVMSLTWLNFASVGLITC